MRKIVSGILTITMIASLLVLPLPIMSAKASAAESSFLTGLNEGEKLIAEAVYTGYSNKASTLKEEVAAFARPRIEEIGSVVQEKMLANKAIFENVTYQQPDLSTIVASIPPAAMLAMIPEETKAQAMAQAQEQVTKQIQQNFVELPSKIETDIGSSIDLVSSSINEEIKELIKSLIFDVGDLIDTTISTSIEAEVEKVIPTIMEDLPDDMQDMSPEEIAAKYQEKIQPAAEAALRPAMEAEIKAVISQMVKEIIEDPLSEMMNPQLTQIGTDACDGIIAQIPSYATAFVPESFIKATVATEIANLNTALPAMIDNQQKTMQASITKTINDFIDSQTKLYINGKMSNIKIRVLNSNAFLEWNNTLKAIGAKSKYNSKTKTITVTKGDTKVVFTLGSRDIKVNGETIKKALNKGEQPQLVKKAPVLPAEEVAELFGYDCDYNQEWGMTTIGVVAASE